MIKEVIVPEHKELKVFCDWCGEEINDYTYMIITLPDGTKKHFHSMYSGGAKGKVNKTCYDKYKYCNSE